MIFQVNATTGGEYETNTQELLLRYMRLVVIFFRPPGLVAGLSNQTGALGAGFPSGRHK